MFCPNCGTQNDESNAKCQKCGFNIKGAVAPKFKGTMLMMNAPPGVAQRVAPPAGAAPVPKPVPAPLAPTPAATAPKKNLAKATMIGVAPPSPGAVAPPAPKPEPKTATLAQGSVPPSRPSVPPSRGVGSIPRPAPVPAARQAGNPPVNPFGGTMLMGAVPDVPPAPAAPVSPAAEPGHALAEDKNSLGVSPTTPAPPNQDHTTAALSTTTPSVAPPAPAVVEKLPSDMPTVASAIAPAVEPQPALAPAVQADWAPPAGFAGDALQPVRGAQPIPSESLSLPGLPKKRSAIVLWLLGIVTLGIYPLVVWLSRGKKNHPGSGV